jgi:hypothetical protein
MIWLKLEMSQVINMRKNENLPSHYFGCVQFSHNYFVMGEKTSEVPPPPPPPPPPNKKQKKIFFGGGGGAGGGISHNGNPKKNLLQIVQRIY